MNSSCNTNREFIDKIRDDIITYLKNSQFEHTPDEEKQEEQEEFLESFKRALFAKHEKMRMASEKRFLEIIIQLTIRRDMRLKQINCENLKQVNMEMTKLEHKFKNMIQVQK